jgi:hypothetical protein
MSLSKVDGVITEGSFDDKDEFERSGVIRDDVFAIRSAKYPTRQITFDCSSLSDDAEFTVGPSMSGVTSITAERAILQKMDDAAAPQLIIKGYSTQTEKCLLVRDESDTDLFTIGLDGAVQGVGAWSAANLSGTNTGDQQAAAVANIAVPASASAEDCANKINALLASLRTAGLLAS